MLFRSLSDAQMNEGIRDPIKAFEYMNRYYVLEGNKRAVSYTHLDVYKRQVDTYEK